MVVEGSARGEREEGREGPPSLGSQPLNQALSHPVNLKQSRFNSSCLSAPGPKAGGRLGSSQGRSGRPRAHAGGETERTGAEMLQRTHRTQTPLYLFTPPSLLSLFSPPVPSLFCCRTLYNTGSRSLSSLKRPLDVAPPRPIIPPLRTRLHQNGLFQLLKCPSDGH